MTEALRLYIGDFHRVFLHFPIVLLTAVFCLDVAQVFFKKKVSKIIYWLLILSVLFLIPTVITGLFASSFYSDTNQALMLHRNLGFVTFIFTVFHLRLRMIAKKLHYFLFLSSVVNFVLVALTSDEGGKIHFGRSIYRNVFKTKPPENTDLHVHTSVSE